MDVEHDAMANFAGLHPDLGDLVPAHALDVADHHQRPADRVQARVLDRRLHASASIAASSRSRMAATPGRVVWADLVARASRG